MKVTPVESSMFYAAGYDPDTHEMEIFFQNGSVYRYKNVAKEDYESLLQADSKGSYLNRKIIGVYEDYEVTRR